jgi:hypothetical protein
MLEELNVDLPNQAAKEEEKSSLHLSASGNEAGNEEVRKKTVENFRVFYGFSIYRKAAQKENPSSTPFPNAPQNSSN